MRQPQIDPPQWVPPSRGLETIELKLKLITPMFGGGHTPREIDVEQPVHAAAIRGHLRFWWRATAGAKYATSRELFQAESGVWGSAATDSAGTIGGPGKVGIKVKGQKFHDPQPCDGKLLGYALFPFQGKRESSGVSEAPAKCISKGEFTVEVTVPAAQAAEIKSAIMAWIQYGGVGARTRRGCGSLAIVSSSVPLGTSLSTAKHRASLVPALNGAMFVTGPPAKDPLDAWSCAVQCLRDFRQGVGVARNEGSQNNRPGRSRYPEADSIRRLANRHSASHSPTHPVQIGFPRADLGMPIVFHFQGNELPDRTLTPANAKMSRMTSPVITKAISSGADGYRPLILILNAPHAWETGDLKLDCAGTARPISRAEVELKPEEREQIGPMHGQPIREALLDYAATQWNFEVMVLK